MAKNKAKQTAAWVIVGLLLIGLLGFGTGGLTGTVRDIGSVGSKSIPVVQYQRALNDQVQAFSAQVGTPISFLQAQQIGLDQQALNSVVAQRTLDNEATKMGLSVGDERIREEVLSIPSFRGLDGSFDRDSYRNSLQQNGLTETQFEDSLREDVARTLLQGAIADGVEAPAIYAETITRYVGEERAITWATLDADDLSAPVPGPTDADITTFYEENPDLFTAPEVRKITYAWLTPAMIQDDVTVDEVSIRNLYEERINQFVRPERRLVERLVYLDMAEFDAAKARLDAGETSFEDLVDERGLSLTDVDMGDVDQDELGTAGEAVFSATPGDILGPFDTDFGPALFRINAVLAADETSFEDATPELREELAASRARRVIENTRESINDLLAGGARMDDLAAQTDLEVGRIDWSADVQDDIAAYDAFRQVAANISEGDFPELYDLADGGIFTATLEEIVPPTLRPLADVRDDVTEAWQAARTQQAVMEEADTAAADIGATTGFETVALTATKDDGLTRRSFLDGTPPGFMNRVFELELGEVTTIDAGTFAIVLRVDNIAIPDADAEGLEANLEAIEGATSAGLAQDIFDVFNAEIQRDTDVNINPAAVAAVHAGFN